MSCPSRTDDAAYVLGALSPRERLDYERHLDGCATCATTVRDLAGLPGLLGRIDPAVLEEVDGDPAPLPATLLPALARQVERESRSRRRRWLALAGTAAATLVLVASAVTAAVTASVTESSADRSDTPAAGSQDPAVPARPMTPLGEVPVRASVRLEPVAWGTRLVLDCSYDTDSVGYELPARVDYLLVVRTRDGRTEQVGSWESVDGTSMTMAAGTAADPADITSVEVRVPDGRVVLRLAV